jgi:murein DD-endopeptidase MepM/ murein hydrolase activator NlpD
MRGFFLSKIATHTHSSHNISMKKIFKIVCIMAFCSSCAFFNKKIEKLVEPVPVTKEKLDVPIKLQEVDAYNGFAKKVFIKLNEKVEMINITCFGKKVGFDRTNSGIRVFFSVPYKHKEKTYKCFLETKSYSKREILVIHVKKYPYQEEFLKVPKKHVDLATKDIERWKKEVLELKKVYEASILKRALFTEPFARPLPSKITSSYGKRRVFNNKKDSWHSGVDFRARTPTEIPSSNRGKIAFTGHLFFNGNTVIIDHGLGIFTMYCHLSKINALVGEIVPKGAIVGISGNTGRSNAPHLHWGVKVAENWINGLSLIKQGI